MKTVFTTQKGVKMNATLDFGSTQSLLHELNYFVVFRDSFWDEELKFYYPLTKDAYIQLIYAFLEDPPELVVQFKLRYSILKENLTFNLHEYLEAISPFQSMSAFGSNPLLIKVDCDSIVANICLKNKAISEKTKTRKLRGSLIKKNKDYILGQRESIYIVGLLPAKVMKVIRTISMSY